MWPELGVLAVVLLAMATKPTGAGSWGFWLVAAALLGAGAGLMLRDFGAAKTRARLGTANDGSDDMREAAT